MPLFQPSQIIEDSSRVNDDEEKLLADDFEKYLEEEEQALAARPKKVHIMDTNNEQHSINLIGKGDSSERQSTIDEALKALFGSHEIVNT